MNCYKCKAEITEYFMDKNEPQVGYLLCLKCAMLPPLFPTATLTPADLALPLEYDAEFLSSPRDEALAAIGRAFDDAIDLAYLT